ncbi:hypothetical protein PRUB_a3166 [Pseudoalteromonas rubra]|uniref:Hydrolase n=1 Tax=Pseudoalteromonas rubra TaxID=43658 RepID=A0A8T0CF18_9GAMM|nr:HAD family hydrolase [Pseudoalteromonas rubra]KAF7788485.1 hypothetical protein PRUB_a3166 [Pseudoalteromonas rubra]
MLTEIKARHWLFDIDGTIAFNNQPVSTALTDALVELSDDSDVIFATARPFRDVLQVLPTELRNNTISCTNGALLFKQHKVYAEQHFTKNTSIRLIHLLEDLDAPYILDCAQGFYLSRTSHPFFEYTQGSYKAPKISQQAALAQGINKIQVFDTQLIELLNRDAERLGITVYPYAGVDFFDISPTGCCKSNLFQQLDIDPLNSIAFGNDSNDLHLIKQAQVGVCIGSHPQLNQAADLTLNQTCPEQALIHIIRERAFENL